MSETVYQYEVEPSAWSRLRGRLDKPRREIWDTSAVMPSQKLPVPMPHRKAVVGPHKKRIHASTIPSNRRWLTEVENLDSTGKTDAALRILYKTVNQQLLAGKFHEVNDLMQRIKERKCSIHILLGLLTVTLQYHSKLASRASFFQHVSKEVLDQKIDEPGLLDGLG